MFTSTSEEELKEALGDDLMEREPKEKLVDGVTKLSSDEDAVILYTKLTRQELEQNTYIAEAKQRGFEEGIEEGIEQEKLKMAKKMLEQNFKIEIIVQITGLEKQQIEKL